MTTQSISLVVVSIAAPNSMLWNNCWLNLRCTTSKPTTHKLRSFVSFRHIRTHLYNWGNQYLHTYKSDRIWKHFKHSNFAKRNHHLMSNLKMSLTKLFIFTIFIICCHLLKDCLIQCKEYRYREPRAYGHINNGRLFESVETEYNFNSINLAKRDTHLNNKIFSRIARRNYKVYSL